MQFRRISVSVKDLQQRQNVEARTCNELALMTLDWTQGELAEGLRCYRSRKFFAAHEHWESVWLVTKGPPKTFLQALIQLAAALHHFQRGNSRGAASLMQTALHRLEPHPDSFGGIAVASLCEEISEWQEKLKTGDAPPDLAPPQIRVCG
jgi:predicted metal-dependent hydrolase